MKLDDASLQEGFTRFVAAAEELERSYVALKARAAAVDLELQSTNQALQRALQEREAIFAALPLGLLAVDGRGGLRCCNREAERLAALCAAAGLDVAALAPGEVAVGEALLRVRRIGLPEGELLLLEDRSHVQELEREVHRLDRLAGLSELALGIAHEIKNPLNGVMGFAALLERAPQAEAVPRYAAKIVQGVRQVDEIVRALLGFARPERQRARAAGVAEIALQAAAAAGLPQRRLQLTGRGDLEVDAEALLRVLTNLFQNAVEAAPDASVRLHVEARGGRAELLVADDGPGVPKDLGRRVLEPFVTSKERGTGLGLPLCARVLAYLGGDLELLNPGEPGARFRVRLPLRRAAATSAVEGAA